MKKLLGGLVLLAAGAGTAFADDYYVSPSGNDSNAGTSPSAPWKTVSKVSGVTLKPGDRVLFEGGQSFAGTLTLDSNDSGADGNPVTITSYGTGRATLNNPSSAHGISANGTRYLKIVNINVAGLGRTTLNSGRGVYLQSVQDAEVDQVEASGFEKAGVEMRYSSRVRVTNVYAHDNGFAGIFAQNSCSNLYVGYCRAINNPGDPAITNNHSGNGILFYGTTGGTIEFCEAAENGWDQPWTGNGPVGIWVATSSKITIQYCISHNNKTRPGAGDGGGFDLDGGAVDCVVQYNYSYENHGCGVLLCTWDANIPCRNNVVRYNVSENDGQTNHNAGIFIHMGGSQSNTHVYNNVIYNSSGRHGVNGGCPSSFYFRNNIFVLRGDGRFVNGVGDGVFQGNLYWNYDGGGSWDGYSTLSAWRTATGKEMLNGNPVGLNVNPLLGNAGFGQKLTDPRKLPELFAYMLQAGSPCIDKGLDLKALFGVEPGTRDLFGNAIPKGAGFDIGAHEVDTGPSAPKITSVAPTSAYVGYAYTYVLQATGNPAPAFSVSGLPPWLAFDGSKTISGTPGAGNVGTTGTIVVTAANSQGTDRQEFKITVTTEDPAFVGHWKLDEASGTAAADSSGKGNHGTVLGNPAWVPSGGKVGGALDLAGYDGSDDYVEIPNSSTLENVQEGDYTLCAWVRPDSAPAGTGDANNAYYGILLKAGMHLGLIYRSDRKFEMCHWLSSGDQVGSVSSGGYDPGTFHHVAGVVNRSAGTIAIYVDGLPAGSSTFSAGAAARDYGTVPWRIGIASPGAATWRWAMDGVVDDVRIYGRALGEAEVKGLAQGGSSPKGAVLREYWNGLAGTAVADLTSSPAFPRSPSGSEFLPSLEAPTDWGDNYGTRLRAYLTAPVDGSYVFWVASDDASELWLSTDANPANRIRIASVDGWTSPQEWTKYPSQQSAPVSLKAGARYYVEVLHKEGGGGDNLAAGWQLPDGTQERPIPASRLAAVDPLDSDGDGVSDAEEIAAGTNPEDSASRPGGGGALGGGEGKEGCGATGAEFLALLLLGFRRR